VSLFFVSLGFLEDWRICVSGLYVARNEAVEALVGRSLLVPRPRQPTVGILYFNLALPAGLQRRHAALKCSA
jgi:hypothetical protein